MREDAAAVRAARDPTVTDVPTPFRRRHGRRRSGRPGTSARSQRRAAATTSRVATTAKVVRTQYIHGSHTSDHAG
jgi:hypothetical protein